MVRSRDGCGEACSKKIWSAAKMQEILIPQSLLCPLYSHWKSFINISLGKTFSIPPFDFRITLHALPTRYDLQTFKKNIHSRYRYSLPQFQLDHA